MRKRSHPRLRLDNRGKASGGADWRQKQASKQVDKASDLDDTSDPAQPVQTGSVPGEVSERLKELVSKTSSGFILLVGSNPTLSASKNRAPHCGALFFEAEKRGERSKW